MLAFVIPLLHPEPSRNWALVIERLEETLRSVATCAVDHHAFTVLVANREAVLPAVPDSVTILRVDYPAPRWPVRRGWIEPRPRSTAIS